MRFCLGNSRGKTTWKAANLQKGRLICQYVPRSQIGPGINYSSVGGGKFHVAKSLSELTNQLHTCDHDLKDRNRQLWTLATSGSWLFCPPARRSIKECEIFQTRINFDPRARLQIKLSSRCCEHGQGVPKLLKASLRQITL